MRRALRPLVLVAIAAALLTAAAPAGAAPDPADQPPLGGAPVYPLVKHSPPTRTPPGFELSPARARAIAESTSQVSSELRKDPRLRVVVGTRGEDQWQVGYFDSGGTERVRILVDDRSGKVTESLTGRQVATPLARGYPGAVAGIANHLYIWLPLCLLFVAPFFDPRRPFRVLHFDLVALLGLGVSQYFFNRGEIGVSVPLVYPVLAYVFARMLIVGFTRDAGRERREPLIPLAPRWALVAAIVALAVFRVGVNLSEDNVIDVGYAGVIGADRIADGKDIYDAGYWSTTQVRGDTYGPVNYLAYVPFEQAFPWSGTWDDLPAARAAAIAFDLLTALGLLLLGFRLRPGGEGRTLGIALCFAWMSYPYTLYTLDSSFNDSLVALGLVAALLLFRSAVARGTFIALAGLAKFGPLALAPLFAAGEDRRRWRDTALFTLAFAAVVAIVVLPFIPDGGLKEMFDRSFGYQASRGSAFSIWGLKPG
ncbi:MAG: glycosyltransferase 87 family protein, partial [Solirubrobacterales bacterium]